MSGGYVKCSFSYTWILFLSCFSMLLLHVVTHRLSGRRGSLQWAIVADIALLSFQVIGAYCQSMARSQSLHAPYGTFIPYQSMSRHACYPSEWMYSVMLELSAACVWWILMQHWARSRKVAERVFCSLAPRLRDYTIWLSTTMSRIFASKRLALARFGQNFFSHSTESLWSRNDNEVYPKKNFSCSNVCVCGWFALEVLEILMRLLWYRYYDIWYDMMRLSGFSLHITCACW